MARFFVSMGFEDTNPPVSVIMEGCIIAARQRGLIGEKERLPIGSGFAVHKNTVIPTDPIIEVTIPDDTPAGRLCNMMTGETSQFYVEVDSEKKTDE